MYTQCYIVHTHDDSQNRSSMKISAARAASRPPPPLAELRLLLIRWTVGALLVHATGHWMLT